MSRWRLRSSVSRSGPNVPARTATTPDCSSTSTIPLTPVISSNTPPNAGTLAPHTPLRPPAAVTGTRCGAQCEQGRDLLRRLGPGDHIGTSRHLAVERPAQRQRPPVAAGFGCRHVAGLGRTHLRDRAEKPVGQRHAGPAQTLAHSVQLDGRGGPGHSGPTYSERREPPASASDGSKVRSWGQAPLRGSGPDPAHVANATPFWGEVGQDAVARSRPGWFAGMHTPAGGTPNDRGDIPRLGHMGTSTTGP